GAAFSGCTNLTSVTLPSTLTSIEYEAFSGCTALTEIEIPAGVTSIADSTFYGCTNLTSITLPSNLTAIDNYAFSGCTSLTEFVIPNGVEILHGTFYGCSNLKKITIPNSVETIEELTFSDVKPNCELIFNTSKNRISVNGSNPFPQDNYKVKFTGTTIPTQDATTSLFNADSNLKEVTLANTVTAIPQNAFEGCSALTKVTIENTPTEPSVLASIGGSAFYNCTSLQTINIPGTVNAIGNQAFFQAGSGNLTMTFDGNQNMAGIVDLSTSGSDYKVVLKKGVPTKGGSSIFANDTKLKEVVYAGGYTLIANAFTGCSRLNKVTFQSYPTIIEHVNNTDYVFPADVTGGITIIFAPINGDMEIHDVSDLFNMSSGDFNIYPLLFKFNNSAPVGSIPPMITIRSGAFSSLTTGTFDYIFASPPDYRITYQATDCFFAGEIGNDATDSTITYTWTISGSSGYWQQ
ncbi:MAG: leucine-rich repeat domain-containing protein, partial [Spirochaetaceae bacterium]|nr:leucine-rich repeat domain-containing protein [Spirochaetaceae bacterium]